MTNEVEVVGQRQVGLPADFLARLAALAKDASAKERQAVSRVSLQSGILNYQGQDVPNNKMDVVFLFGAHRNVWYAGAFDPDNVVNPACFAISEDDEGMAPHGNVAEPCHPTCVGCPKDLWGSAPPRNGKPSKGKACKQTRRLVFMPADALAGGADNIKTAERAIIDLPVTSVKNYGSFVQALSAIASVPPWAAVCEVSVVQDKKTQFQVLFKPMRVIDNVEQLMAIESTLEAAKLIAMEPYDETTAWLTPEGQEPVPETTAAAAKKKKF